MRHATPRTPKARDFEIYHAVVAANQTPAEVAKQFQISQPRVRQMVARVRRWKIKRVRWDDQAIPLPHRRYLALHEERLRLENDYQWQRQIIAQLAGPQVEASQHTRDSVAITQQRHSKFGKVTAAHFKELRGQRLSILAVQLQETEAEAALIKANEQISIWLEVAVAGKSRRYIGARMTPPTQGLRNTPTLLPPPRTTL